MRSRTRPLLWCCAVLLLAACTRVVDGTASPVYGGPSGVFNVGALLLDDSRMRAITGAGDDLTIIPSMDGGSPVDIEALAEIVPKECRFIYAETVTFGPDVEAFHKTTYQAPPIGALISEGGAAYRDPDTARRAFDALVATVKGCATTTSGRLFVGKWKADADSLHLRPGDCGRDYRVLSTMLLEVTFCGFPESVSDIVMTNIMANVPGR
ncbi:sensor domain-containing protein [Mycobacterium bourgelatii]|uniref:Sensor domain-containing protein n=1 Tax=Mycobacterium bourgelatii TaxID=1273442 RepID=A0A7I9YLK0_MYCBU|nr:sensor domain-containing protein [Mycobacterium bourgelatii]MCV6977948.1 sensor domain-containing protein [Mycobacterium bourgelatii]GFG89566.1 sensor domain-containing protein [Mycobacterium bourgelatii]